MKIYVTGAKGYIGKALVKAGALSVDCDITDIDDVRRHFQGRSGVVFHLAGKSNVDFCEKPENRETVINTNLLGTRNVMSTLSKYRLKGVLLSSDQIWGGGIFEKHKEDSRKTIPVNYYGLSKMSAEAATLSCGMNVIRSSYVFDWERLSNSMASSDMAYPTFIRRSFIYLPDFINYLLEYADRFHSMPDVLHMAGSETVSWYTFMKEVGNRFKFKVHPRFFEKKGMAPRPYYGGLDTGLSRSLGFRPVSYVDGITRMKNES